MSAASTYKLGLRKPRGLKLSTYLARRDRVFWQYPTRGTVTRDDNTKDGLAVTKKKRPGSKAHEKPSDATIDGRA